MLEKKQLEEILCLKEINCRALPFGIVKDAKINLRRVGKIMKRGGDFSLCGTDSVELGVWLYENYPRLCGIAGNDARTLLGFGFIRGRGRPTYYDFFKKILLCESDFSENMLEDIFEICCRNEDNIKNPSSLVYLFRLAVCERICECFYDAHRNGNSHQRELEKIQGLFETLDKLCLFDEERVLSMCPVEKALYADPCGIYPKQTTATKISYRKNLVRLSRKRRISELALAKELVEESRKADGNEGHIGKYLCDRPHAGKTYLLFVAFLTAAFSCLLCMLSPLLIVCVLPVYGVSCLITDRLYSRFLLKEFTVPETELSEIPDKSGVMAVVTVLLTDEESAGEVCDELEKMYFSNGGKNVYFGLLCDLADNSRKRFPDDEKIIRCVSGQIRDLRKRYGDKFFFFLRERDYCPSEEIYSCPERKRGAIMALTELLCGKRDGFLHESIKPSEKICENIRYILTLDSDTRLSFGSIKRMAGVMTHPCNRPHIDKKRCVVTEGYGILQPSVSPSVRASTRTFFTSVMCGHGGIDGYGAGITDAAMSLFGQGIFCGKGMLDKNAFYAVLCGKNAFEEGKILSHDAPEGARLRCAYVPDIVMTDSFPSEELSYFKRKHRWIRGDVQNIDFLGKYVKSADGEKIRNGISVASRFFIWQNIYFALLPIFVLASLVLSLFAGESGALLVTVSLSVYLLPLVHTLYDGLKRLLCRKGVGAFYSRGIYTAVRTELLNVLFRICALPKSAFVSLDAIVRSVYRMTLSKKRLLEWTTSAQNDAEKSDGLLGYVAKNLVCAIFGTAFFVLSDSGFMRLLGLLWLFFPVFAYFSGKCRPRSLQTMTKRQREMLTGYCADMWSFFSENVTPDTHFLPCDNISFYPAGKTARMTSPTNIGLYLMSCVCARRLGFIDSGELDKRLLETLASVSRLEAYEGLLYNWYDVYTAQPMKPKYISSVDIGNFIACLTTLAGATMEYRDELSHFEEISALCDTLLEKSNPVPLYDSKRKLFYIGAEDNGGRLLYDKNRYDMLMSEARILSFVAVARGSVPATHYFSLSRSFIKGGAYSGLCSWSGTVFEFFMPRLFIRPAEGSLLYEAQRFAFERIRRGGVQTKWGYIFGISESCYNELDESENYRYFAFGLEEIAGRVFENQRVFSPYSSFLCLCMSVKESLSSLEAFGRLGAYGEYGFYESVDFERRGPENEAGIVRCFMSHHIGMSLCAAVNALCGEAVSKWFLSDKRMSAAMLLCDEKIPYASEASGCCREVKLFRKKSRFLLKKQDETPCIYARLRSNNARLYVKRGRLSPKTDGKLLLARDGVYPFSLGAFCAAVSVGQEVFYIDARSTLFSGNGYAELTKKIVLSTAEEYMAGLRLSLGKNASDIVRMKLRLVGASGQRQRKIGVSFSFFPLLDTRDGNFVCNFFDRGDFVLEKRENSVYFGRKSHNKCFVARMISGKSRTAEIRNEEIILTAIAEEKAGAYETELEIAVSGDEIKALCTYPDNGCRAAEKIPIDSGENPWHLMSGRCFNTLVSEKSLGVSFAGDINLSRVTHFDGVGYGGSAVGERLVFDDGEGFDLCANANKTFLKSDCAVYEGRFRGYGYTVRVLICPSFPAKKIVVRTCCPARVRLELVPDKGCDGTRFIGSGGVFFGKAGASSECVGFLFGYAETCEGERIGAEYKTADKIAAFIPSVSERVEGAIEYVFFIGLSEEHRAHEFFALQLAQSNAENEEPDGFYASICYDIADIPENILGVLRKYFVFPKNNMCHRFFVKTQMPLHSFDTLLLIYADADLGQEALLSLFAANEPEDCLTLMLISLCTCEYIRLTQNASFADLCIGSESVYRRCLGYLYRVGADGGYGDLYSLCLGELSRLSRSLGDIKTAEALCEMKRGADTGKEGGTFL